MIREREWTKRKNIILYIIVFSSLQPKYILYKGKKRFYNLYDLNMQKTRAKVGSCGACGPVLSAAVREDVPPFRLIREKKGGTHVLHWP